MRATDPEPTKTRTDRRTCTHCDASVAGCDARRWLSGAWCCGRCAGNHDTANAS